MTTNLAPMIVLSCCISCALVSCAGMQQLPPTYTNDMDMTFNGVMAPTLFMMGSPHDEPGRGALEPRHKVELTEPIYVQTTEVTQGQWEALMGDNPSYHADCGDSCPVEGVTWYEAVEFCNRLSEREGLTPAYAIAGTEVTWDRPADGYRLPTEAEWEYAARAGHDTGLPNGEITVDPHSCELDPNLDAIGWYCGNTSAEPQPVAGKAPNAFGLHDMHGNVAEWCWDWFDDYEFDDPFRAVTEPTGPADAPGPFSGKSYRGGGAYDFADACRSAKRLHRRPELFGLIGLRVVRYVSPGP